QAELPWHLRAGREPAEAAGDHQMDDEEELAVEFEHDALAEAADGVDVPAFQLGRRRIERAEDKRARQSDFEQRLPEEPLLERFDVDGHIREFRHRFGDYPWYMRNVLSGVLLLLAAVALASRQPVGTSGGPPPPPPRP